MESIYFAVITYGTIGFGDVTPQSMDYTVSMEVIRVLMFASTGLALVGLCFTLYREAADNNMKVITKKMSVIPQRISTVQAQFIETIQRQRSLTRSQSTNSNKMVWGRVRVGDILDAREGRGGISGLPRPPSAPALLGEGMQKPGPVLRSSIWSRISLRDLSVERSDQIPSTSSVTEPTERCELLDKILNTIDDGSEQGLSDTADQQEDGLQISRKHTYECREDPLIIGGEANGEIFKITGGIDLRPDVDRKESENESTAGNLDINSIKIISAGR